ncbi:hypothetical protein PHYBOEH_002865 [Phytophthora boehmeriae]|uniref:SAP domain-containing protein n=1 Tax=Phytophthora boehmeriae TaxID=109152 RepID=A0A8T1WPV0_9STRA|nr:hypothetical protein PHYBOEH_002865 [Phytophthora boehmeriae]
MAFLLRKKPNARVPTGKDAVNFRKLLFLPIKDTEDLLTDEAWERLDLRCLALMKVKMLRASCIARGLPKNGGKRILVQRLTASLTEQRSGEIRRRQEEEEEYQRQLDMLGGVWSFGSGFAGQLGHGDLESSAAPRLIKKLRGRSIARVYAGFDSDVAFAISRTGDVFVWGKRAGPTGLPLGSSLKDLMRQTYEHDSDLDASDSEDRDTREDMGSKTKGPNGKIAKAEIIEEDRDMSTLSTFGADDESNESGDEDDEGGEEDFVNPVKLLSLCGEGLNHIAVGRVHCCALTKDGDVFTWGHNDHCQLGTELVHNLPESLSKKARVRYGVDATEPQLWERTVSEACVISKVDVGTNHTFVLTAKSEVIAFGATYNTNDHSSFARNIAKLRVSQISCGALHAGLVTTEGQAYTWGSGDGGRLGHGDSASCVNPKLVEALKTDIIVELACACWHTVAVVLIPPLLKGGVVYTWGSGRLGQLAQGGKQISTTPGLVTDFLTTHALIKTVCAGMYHNVALSVDDEVFTWGSNSNGCLGRPEELGDLEENFCAVPGRVEGMEEFVGRPCSIACGREFTLIATKPYIGPNREEVERRKQEQLEQAESLLRQTNVVNDEKRAQLDRIRQSKHATIISHLNERFPKCAICTTGLICPGFQADNENPTLCKHCMHENRKHQDRHKERDRTVTLEYLMSAVEKLGITIDFSRIPDIELEEELEFELEEQDE